MSYFIIHFLYLAIVILSLLMIISFTYNAIKNSAKHKIALEMQKQRDDLSRQFEELKQQQEKHNHHIQASHAEIELTREKLSQRELEIDILKQKASETISNARRIKENSEIKLLQVLQENINLKNEVNSSRQRSKRLANRLKSRA